MQNGIIMNHTNKSINSDYIILCDQDATMAFLPSLFFSFLFIKPDTYHSEKGIEEHGFYE